MATVIITDFRVARVLGNAELTLEYDIVFDVFDLATNVGYVESWGFVDADVDADIDVDADDRVGSRVVRREPVRAEGRDRVRRVRVRRMRWDELDLDDDTWGDDEELRAEVRLEPILPTTVEVESDAVLVNAAS